MGASAIKPVLSNQLAIAQQRVLQIYPLFLVPRPLPFNGIDLRKLEALNLNGAPYT